MQHSKQFKRAPTGLIFASPKFAIGFDVRVKTFEGSPRRGRLPPKDALHTFNAALPVAPAHVYVRRSHLSAMPPSRLRS